MRRCRKGLGISPMDYPAEPIEPIEPIKPAEPLSQTITGQHAQRANLDPPKISPINVKKIFDIYFYFC